MIKKKTIKIKLKEGLQNRVDAISQKAKAKRDGKDMGKYVFK